MPDPIQKLSLLDDATRFEPAGDQPVAERAAAASRPPKPLPCISEVSTPTGKKPMLKAMMTTACERNCFYCPFRAGRSKTPRITYTPDEMAKTYDTIQRAGLVEGLFLSSGIIKGGVTTQDKILDAAEILRKHYNYRGFIHLKVMPGAEYDQVRRAMQLADRASINLEGATAERLAALAPKKDFWNELFLRLQWISELRRKEGLRASVVTQFVVGAVGDTDLELLHTSDHLYNQLGLRRTYFMAFHPVSQTPFESLTPVSQQREFRLYQASFLLRDYGWNLEDMPFLRDGNLPLDIDPKLAWAKENLTETPVEVNRADRGELLRVPGIGPKTADAIVATRRRQRIREPGHLRALGLRDVGKATPYLLLDGKMAARQMSLF
ncbi:MAG: radical SAM protein [Anaerolineales bacterium]|nr:radical SAM protein [Anaerolineales bacterium]